MMSAQYILRFIDVGHEVRRPPLVAMEFLHERRIATGAPNRARGLINSLVDRFAKSRRDVPRRGVALRVFTPYGKPAVRVRC
jgi:hypothetical protein